MWGKVVTSFLLFAVLAIASAADNNTKVVCYYNSKAFGKEGLAKVTIADLAQDAGLAQCTHLVFGWAGISEQSKVISLNVNQDLDHGKGLFRLTTQTKTKFPGLKVLLGIGGDAQGEPEKWLSLLESSTSRIAFINSAYDIVKTYSFDGIDLAFEFPKIKPKKIRSGLGSAFYSFKKAIGAAGKPVDEKSEEHKEEFTALVREIKNSIRPEGLILSVTVNPNVNSSLYIDVPSIKDNVDWINLNMYDVQTSRRNDKEADFSAPIYAASERDPQLCVDYTVTDMITRGLPANKIVIGIPTYAHSWNIKEGATSTGVPPVTADGPAPEGIQTHTEGILSYPEVCSKLMNAQNKDLKGENGPLRKVGDPTKRFGNYAYRLPDGSGKFGMWVSYEDADTAGNKAFYAKTKNLAGVSINDLTMDDFRGACTGDKFPILKAARYRLF